MKPKPLISRSLTKILLFVGLFSAGPVPLHAAPLCSAVFRSGQDTNSVWSEHIADAIGQGDLFDSPGFYESFQNHPERTEKLIRKWYSFFTRDLRQSFAALPASYELLLLDPGIATRADDFVSFARARLLENPSLSPREMRRLFAQSLGTMRVFRGLILTPDEASRIKENGMKARGLMESYANKRLQSEFDGDIISIGDLNAVMNGFLGEVDSRLMGRQLSRSMLLSVSKWIEVTSAGAWSPKGRALEPSKGFYLFEMEVPTLSVIRLEGRFNSLTKNLGSWRFFESTSFGSAEKFRVSVDDPDFEMFIFGAIPASSIKQMHAYEQRPPLWWPAN